YLSEGREKVLRSLNKAHGEELGFSQVNTGQNTNLINYVCELAGTPTAVDRDNQGSRGNLLDLYCGNGNFSFPLNLKGWRIYGIDQSRQAINAARQSANADTFFSKADCAYEVRKLAQRNRHFELVIMDPPRIGAEENLL